MKTFINTLLTFILATATALSSATVSAETITYFHLDALGSPVAASDEAGNILWREEYAPYGDRIRVEDPANTHGFTGKFHEEDLGLTYFGARWYDPVAGRFMGVDPVEYREGDVHSFNRYAYANNNPYRFVDPDGRAAETVLDVVSFGLSLHAFRNEPSLLNGLGLAYDGVAMAVPFLPAGFGIIKNADSTVDAIRAADKVGDGANGSMHLSKAVFGHTFTKHGQDATEFLMSRAKGSGKPQGQFLDDQAAARLIQDNLNKLGNGPISIPVPEGFRARIVNPDGSFSFPRSIRLVPGGKGVKTAYPEP